MISGFGKKLRQLRESHGATIEEISEATNIDPSYFEAIERDDLAVLPGRAYGKFYIRVYGEYLGFDPDPLIAEYDLELAAIDPDVIVEEEEAPDHEWKEALRKTRAAAAAKRQAALEAERVEEESSEPEPEPEPEPEEPALILEPEPEAASERREYPRSHWRLLATAIVASTILSIMIWAVMHCSGVQTPGGGPVEQQRPPEITELQGVVEEEAEPEEVQPVEPEPAPGKLSVTEFGVGRRIVNYSLEGEDDRFEEGEVVWFVTRVRGGERGDSIRHLWFREGGRIQIVDLDLGSAHYRTRSKKTLWGVGNWVVEAQDSEGRILAREEFECVPR